MQPDLEHRFVKGEVYDTCCHIPPLADHFATYIILSPTESVPHTKAKQKKRYTVKRTCRNSWV